MIGAPLYCAGSRARDPPTPAATAAEAPLAFGGEGSVAAGLPPRSVS